MERDDWSGRLPKVGVVGADEATVDSLDDAVDATVRHTDPGSAETFDVVIANGESAILSLVRMGATEAILPVDVGSGIEDVAAADLEVAVEDIVQGAFYAVDRPLLSVAVADETYDALMDIMAVTTEPARISEFAVATQTRGSSRPVDTVRADGVVVATSAGTPGYATAAGGPVLEPESSGVSVVPIGPFRIEQTHWVLELPASLTVARDDATVSLLVDDGDVGEVPAHEPIELSWGTPLELLRTDHSRSPFAEDVG